MKVMGINSLVNINGEYKSILFYDFDNIPYTCVNRIIEYLNSNEISVSVFKTSVNSYHLISFQLFDLDKVSNIQEKIKSISLEMGFENDYMNIYEAINHFMEGNTLRITDKGDGKTPAYIETQFADKNHFTYTISLKHLKVYETMGLDDKSAVLWKIFYNPTDCPIVFISYETVHNLRE